MAEPSGILADTSVWIKFFRSPQTSEALHLDLLLEAKAVRTCAPVRVEVISGARTQRERDRLRELFQAIPLLEPPAELWDQIEETRFDLARKGHQASLVDLMIACVASHHRVPLWTLDVDFDSIRQSLWFPRYLSE